MAPPEHRLPVDVVGAAELRSPRGIGLKLDASGEKLSIVAGAPSDLFRLWRERPRRKTRSESLARLHKVARVTGLSFHLQIGPRTVAWLGPNSAGSWLSRMLRMDPVEIRIWDSLAAAFQSWSFRGS